MYFTDTRVKAYLRPTMKNVKNLITVKLVTILALMSGSAFAQGGALCGTFDRELLIQVNPNNTLSLIDPEAAQGRQVMATFNQIDVNYTQAGLVYEANTRNATIPNPNQYVGGARLGELQWVIMTVNAAPGRVVTTNNIITGSLKLQKTNGQTFQKLVTCTLNQSSFIRLQ